MLSEPAVVLAAHDTTLGRMRILALSADETLIGQFLRLAVAEADHAANERAGMAAELERAEAARLRMLGAAMGVSLTGPSQRRWGRERASAANQAGDDAVRGVAPFVAALTTSYTT